jgi:hypothetical protein
MSVGVGEGGVLVGDGGVFGDLGRGEGGSGIEARVYLFGRSEDGGDHLGGSSLRVRSIELGQVFPEEVAAVDDLAAAHVEEVDGEHAVLVVEAEDVGVLVVGGGDALLVLHLVDGDDLVAQAGGELELLGFRRPAPCAGEGGFELAGLAVEEELHVADGLLVGLGGGEAFDAGAEAALDVVLQAGAGVVAERSTLQLGMRKLRWMRSTRRWARLPGK